MNWHDDCFCVCTDCCCCLFVGRVCGGNLNSVVGRTKYVMNVCGGMCVVVIFACCYWVSRHGVFCDVVMVAVLSGAERKYSLLCDVDVNLVWLSGFH